MAFSRIRKKCGFPIGTWARATIESWDAQGFSVALPWSLCLLSWPSGSGVSQLFSWLPPPTGGRSGYCEGLVTKCEVRKVLKQVGLNKSQGLDGLSYEEYLRMSHMFVPCLTDVFNHWFAQGAIPGRITKGMITLLRKGGIMFYYRWLQAHNSAKYRVKDFGPGLS